MVFRDKCFRVEFDFELGFNSKYFNIIFMLMDWDGFFKDIFDIWGIEKDWIRFVKC